MEELNRNTKTYYEVLQMLLEEKDVENIPGICAELRCQPIEFLPIGIIEGSSKKYLEYEDEWYRSMDLSIKNHRGIETNPIWQGCATENGNVNSNYGWCVFHPDNYEQFEHAKYALLNDKHSRRAVIIYTRPNIHIEQCDNIHAKQDMMCTCYTMFIIRKDFVDMHVHMRSNDVWFGLRYDLAWQQTVYNMMFMKLIKKYPTLHTGNIIWIADSLHLYSRDEDKVREYIEKINAR